MTDKEKIEVTKLIRKMYDVGYSGIIRVGSANYQSRENYAIKKLIETENEVFKLLNKL